MAFSRKLLNDGEELVLDLHPHWFSFWRPVLALVATIVLGLWVMFGLDDAPGAVEAFAGLLIVASVIWFGVVYSRWVTTNFVVTTDRLVYRHGVLAKHGIEIPLDRVNTVFFSQSLLERMLGSGDLTIESAGEMGRQDFHNVRKPSAVQNEIYKQVEANENRKFDRVGRGDHGGAPSIPDQIDQLDALRQRGVLSDAEFQAKKAQLLDRM